MTPRRVYVFGASGSGTTTLGAQLALRLSVPHIDCDDHYWAPSDPPFSQKRSIADRVRSMKNALGGGGWVITGSCHGWGYEIIESASLLVFVTLDTPTRLKRLEHRQADRFGDRIRQGGDMADIHAEFMEWASKYDDPYFAGRSLEQHQHWFGSQPGAKCHVDGGQPVPVCVKQVMAHLV